MDWTVILGAGGASALILAAKEVLVWALNRRAQKDDKKDSQEASMQELRQLVEAGFSQVNLKIAEFGDDIKKVHAQIEIINTKQDIQCEGLVAILGNTIEYLAGKYICRGGITMEELKSLDALFVPYDKNGGNGPRARQYKQCQKLPLLKTVIQEEKGE